MTKAVLLFVAFLFLRVQAATTTAPSLQMSLDNIDVGRLPANVTAFGVFTVQLFEGHKVIELPGEPLDSMGLMVGPEKGITGITARIHAIASGRRFPEFGVGLAGTSGYKLWLIPAQKVVQLQKGDEVLASVAYTAWATATWTTFRLQLQKKSDGGTTISGRIWQDGRAEPREATITAEDKESPAEGRAAVWANPYSGTPLRFSDIMLVP